MKCPNCGVSDEVNVSHIPPGKALLRCKSCFTSFEILIKPDDVPLADCRLEGDYLVVVCPYCGSVFNSSPDVCEQGLFWRCPNCEAVFRLPELDQRQVHSEKTEVEPSLPETEVPLDSGSDNFADEGKFQIGDIPSDELEALTQEFSGEKLLIEPLESSTETSAIPEEESQPEENAEMAPPLTEKEKFSAQFIVKMGGGEVGPISYNVLEDWVRAGMIPRETLIAKVGDNKFYRADRIPELLAIFEGKQSTGSAIKEILKEESTGEKIIHGITAGLLGGLVGGIIAAPVVLLGFWNPAPAFNSVLASLVFILGSVAIGAGIGAINSVLSIWILDYPWILPIQAGLAAVFGLAIAVFNLFFLGEFLQDSLLSGVLVFVFAFVIGYFTMLFHRKFYEKF